MADDTVNGACCSWCGIYFVKNHEYPVVCHSCWKDAKPSEREGVQRATFREM